MCYGQRILNEYGKKIIQLEAGEKLEGLDKYKQHTATYGDEDRNWGGEKQLNVFKIWESQGKKTDNNNIAFVTMGGSDWYLAAFARSFGEVGDYIELQIKDSSTPFRAIIADAKSGADKEGNGYNDGAAFFQDNNNPDLWWHLGHKYGDEVNMVEINLKNEDKIPSTQYLNSLKPVISVQNGGSCFDHPDAPVALTGTYVIQASAATTSYTPASTSNQRREESFASVVLDMARSLITFLSTTLDNGLSGREDSGNMYYAQDDQQGMNNYDVPIVGDANVMNTCRQLSQYLMSKHAHYGWGTSHDIEKAFANPDYNVCCATYVAIVLWKSGLLTPEQINRFNYNWTGNGGIPSMLEEFGWRRVSPSAASPGDVIVNFEVHAAIYAGNGKVWDEYSGVIESSGHPSGQPNSYNISGCQVWRAPGR